MRKEIPVKAYALPQGYKAEVYSRDNGYEVVLYNEQGEVVSTTHHTRVAFRELQDALEADRRTTVAYGPLRTPLSRGDRPHVVGCIPRASGVL